MRPATIPRNSVFRPAISRTDQWTPESPSGEAPAEGANEQVRHREDRPRERCEGRNGGEGDNHQPDQCEARHDQDEQHDPQKGGPGDPFEPVCHGNTASTPASRVIWSPAGDSTNQLAPNAFSPWPVVSPGLLSPENL
jgi:hypothetical protein